MTNGYRDCSLRATVEELHFTLQREALNTATQRSVPRNRAESGELYTYNNVVSTRSHCIGRRSNRLITPRVFCLNLIQLHSMKRINEKSEKKLRKKKLSRM